MSKELCEEHDTELDEWGCWVCQPDAPHSQPFSGWIEMG